MSKYSINCSPVEDTKRIFNRFFCILALLLVYGACTAAAESSAEAGIALGEVVVRANRPITETGITKTEIDSAALRENIALSMADVLGYHSSLFIKSSGRATLSTVSFRGTAPSHTAVCWNGMPVNSPALGMTDLSLIPSYFIDKTTLLHGSSSIVKTSGGLGGMVDLSTSPASIEKGFTLQYVQGIGSYTTLDEFIRFTYGSDKWKTSTRAVLSTSKNNFKFTNYDKKENVYDENYNIVSQYHPRERNKNGAYRDFHLLQQVYFTPNRANRLGLDIWWTDSRREIAPTTVDYNASTVYENLQREKTVRTVANWQFIHDADRLTVKAGYLHTWLAYDYGRTIAETDKRKVTESRTRVNTFFGQATYDHNFSDCVFLTADLKANRSNVRTINLAALNADPGYDKHRLDFDGAVTARWQATESLGLAATLREEMADGDFSPVVPAFYFDWTLPRVPYLTAKGSVARNFHRPTLNDLYFKPGGNPDLKPEQGISYDLGLASACRLDNVDFTADLTWYDSYISDWILWLPTNKGFFTPSNVRKVHSYGIEVNTSAGFKPFTDSTLDFRIGYAWTPSVNSSGKISDNDKSVGRQIPYVPRNTASATLTFTWRNWTLLWKGCYYSTRYTMTSNENSISGRLKPYFMSDLDLERRFPMKPLDLSVKASINNLFNTDYQTVMSHPMPGINFEVFISITPKFGRKR